MIKINWKAIVEFIKKVIEVFKSRKKGGKKMKLVGLVLGLLIAGSAVSAEMIAIPSDFNAKQGLAIEWSSGNLKNTTTFEVAQTRPCETWPKWINALWDGITVDAGFLYDANSADNAIIGVSKTFGTLGKYLPINFPLADKIQISITPFGVEARHFTSDLGWGGFSGGSYAKATIKF